MFLRDLRKEECKLSTNVYDKGSVFDFRPDRFTAYYTPEGCDELEYQGVGWATRVVERDMWVAKTEIVPMVAWGAGTTPLDQVTNAPGKFRIVRPE